PRLGGISPTRMLIVDYDSERLNEWRISCTALGTCHDENNANECWLGNGDGSVHVLMKPTFVDGSSPFVPYFRTTKIRKAARHIVHRVEVFLGPTASTPEAQTWTLNYRLDEDTVGRDVTLSRVNA